MEERTNLPDIDHEHPRLTLHGFASATARRAFKQTERFRYWVPEWTPSRCGFVQQVGPVMPLLREANPQSIEDWETYYLNFVRTHYGVPGVTRLQQVARWFAAFTRTCSYSDPDATHTHGVCEKRQADIHPDERICVHKGTEPLTQREALTTVLIHVLDESYQGWRAEHDTLDALRKTAAGTDLTFEFAPEWLDTLFNADIIGIRNGEVVLVIQVKPPTWFSIRAALLSKRSEERKLRDLERVLPNAQPFYINSWDIARGVVHLIP